MLQRAIACVSVGLLLLAQSVMADDYVTAGSAYNVSNGKLLYRELFGNLDAEKNVTIDYTTPDGQVFATKRLSYKGELFQPEFELKDLRNEEVTYARFEGPRLIAGHEMKYGRQEKVFLDNANLVIDAGFDAFIQLNWDRIAQGQRMSFTYLIPSEQATTSLDIAKIKAKNSPLYDKEIGREWLYLRLKPTKLFSDPIHLAYDPRGRYLMRYQGRSNVNDPKGVPWYVRIDYQYVN